MISIQNYWDTTSALIGQFISFSAHVNAWKIWKYWVFLLSLLYRSNIQYSLWDNRRPNRKVFKSLVIYTRSPNILHGFLCWQTERKCGLLLIQTAECRKQSSFHNMFTSQFRKVNQTLTNTDWYGFQEFFLGVHFCYKEKMIRLQSGEKFT